MRRRERGEKEREREQERGRERGAGERERDKCADETDKEGLCHELKRSALDELKTVFQYQ